MVDHPIRSRGKYPVPAHSQPPGQGAQDRPLDDVLADITAARDELRRQFQTDDELTEIEDRLDHPTAREARRRKG